MRLQIGKQPEGKQPESDSSGVMAALMECHTRIRYFTGVADRLSQAPSETPAEDLAEAAAGVAMYFGAGLPLHEADEEESLRPRLVGRSPEVDAGLEEMTRQHDALHGPVATLVELTSGISEAPEMPMSREVRKRLTETVATLLPAWEEHFGLEENVLFPAIGRLASPAELEDVREEMRQRRDEPV